MDRGSGRLGLLGVKMRRGMVGLAVALAIPVGSLVLMAACGGPGSPSPPLMSNPMDATTSADSTATGDTDPGFGDVTLPEAPEGFFDVGAIEDAGLNLESGFGLDGSFDGEFSDVGTGDGTF
jgi:hypothetical protein